MTADPFPVQKKRLFDLKHPQARTICFYLPQFHRIPENDMWWGDGFTEWTNVKRGKPVFDGHYQPHIPQDLGYYDLMMSPDIQQAQVDLARLYGIHGFCFYWYWFSNKRLLEKPVEKWLASSVDFPFCLCWANENWTRRWDGHDYELLMFQDHSPEDDLACLDAMSAYLKDDRYITINGKPLILIYRPSRLPAAYETADRWRSWAYAQGIGDIFLAYPQSHELRAPGTPQIYGFDAAIEFPPNMLEAPTLEPETPFFKGYRGHIYDWKAYVRYSENYPDPDYKIFRCICPGWDNTARRPETSSIYAGNTPRDFARWTANAVTDAHKRATTPDERIIFCNAWNEWAEGAHLEPDNQYGYAFLEALSRSLDPAACPRTVTIITDGTYQNFSAFSSRLYQSGFQVQIICLGTKVRPEWATEGARSMWSVHDVMTASDLRTILRVERQEHAQLAVTDSKSSILTCLSEAGYLGIHMTDMQDKERESGQNITEFVFRTLDLAGRPIPRITGLIPYKIPDISKVHAWTMGQNFPLYDVISAPTWHTALSLITSEFVWVFLPNDPCDSFFLGTIMDSLPQQPHISAGLCQMQDPLDPNIPKPESRIGSALFRTESLRQVLWDHMPPETAHQPLQSTWLDVCNWIRNTGEAVIYINHTVSSNQEETR